MLGGPSALVNNAIRHNDDGSTSIQPERAREVLYADCSAADSAWATSLLVPQQPGHGRGVPGRIAPKTTQGTYIHCEQDRALSPRPSQVRMAGRCTKIVSLNSSHSPFISQPEWLARRILAI